VCVRVDKKKPLTPYPWALRPSVRPSWECLPTHLLRLQSRLTPWFALRSVAGRSRAADVRIPSRYLYILVGAAPRQDKTSRFLLGISSARSAHVYIHQRRRSRALGGSRDWGYPGLLWRDVHGVAWSGIGRAGAGGGGDGACPAVIGSLGFGTER
jgi:hypothetical protein